MIVQRFNLNLIPNQSPVVVHVNQYDTGTGRLVATLYEGNEPYSPNGTAVIQGTKPDGHGFQYTATLDGNVVTADLTEQMSPVAGDVRAQIVVTESSGVTGTFVFIMRVQPSALPSDADMSESDYPLIEEAIREAQEAVIDSRDNAENSEAWAQGTRGGIPVGPTDPTYQHNAEYWAHQAEGAASGVSTFNGRSGFVLPIAGDYDSEKILLTSALHIGGETQDNVQEALEALSDGGGHTSGGSTITVTTIETTLYGEAVTITDGTSTFTGVFDNSGVCVIDGVTATGTLTVTSGGASAQLTVPYYGNYTVVLSFWSATINITTDPDVVSAIVKKDGVQIGTVNFTSGSGTYIAGSTGAYTFTATVGGIDFTSPTVNATQQTTYNTTIDIFSATLSISTSSSDLYGKTITIKKGSTTVGTTAFSAQGSATYTVHETGTYTCECEGYSGNATVSAEQTYNVTINSIPDGETVTPVNDVEIWLECANLSSTGYTTMSQILADSSTLAALIADANAVKYMVRSTGFATDVCGNSGAMSLIGLNNNCANSLLANSTWTTAICNSTYFESVLNVKVPTMTGSTTPSGEAFGSYPVAGRAEAWKAFDGDNTSYFDSYNNGNTLYPITLGYKFTEKVNVKYVVGYNRVNSNPANVYAPKKLKVQGKANNAWTDISSEITNSDSASGHTFMQQVVNPQNIMCDEAQIYITEGYTELECAVSELQFYGRKDV